MKKEAIEKLRKFIEKNPPLKKNGPEYWNKNDWKSHLDKKVPEWKELLRSVESWR